jgi:hypothetical protein
MKERGGKTELKVQASITSCQLKGVMLTKTQPKINKPQFYQAIVDNLTKRLRDSDLVIMLKPMEETYRRVGCQRVYFVCVMVRDGL